MRAISFSTSRRLLHYVPPADLAYLKSSELQKRLYLGSLERNLIQEVIHQYEKVTSPLKKAKMIAQQNARRVSGEFTVKKFLPDFTISSFLKEAESIYITYHQSFAQGDLITMRSVTTPRFFSELKRFIEQESKRVTKLSWKLHEFTDDHRINDVIAVEFNYQEELVNIAQIGVQFESKQSLVRMVGSANPVPKLFEPLTPLREIFVFERHLDNPFSTWKIVGKMDKGLKEEAAAQKKAQETQEQLVKGRNTS